MRSAASAYLRIVPVGYGFFAAVQISASILNVFHRPYLAGGLSLVQIGAVAVPFSFLLSLLFGAAGVFIAILSSFIISGIFSLTVVRKYSGMYLQDTTDQVRSS